MSPPLPTRKDAPSPPGPGAARVRLVVVALAVLGFVVYAGLLFRGGSEFVNVDDDDYVVRNRYVQAGPTAESVRWAFTTFHAYNWHPLTWLSLELEYPLHGLSPVGFRAVNVLLHVANVLLLFGVLWRMTGTLWPSAFVAALFGVHPLHVESVAWVSERKDVLSALFGMLTLAAYVGYARRPGPGRYLLVVGLFALGLLAKPMLVTLPCVLLLLDYWPLARLNLSSLTPHPSSLIPRPSPLRLLLEKLPLLALAAASSTMTMRAQQAVRKDVPLDQRLGNALVAYVRYLAKTVWPSDLAIFYPHPADRLPAWQVVGAALFLAAVTAAAVWQVRRRPYLAVGWFWYLGTLVPVIGLVQVGNQALADRYTYIPLIGIFIAVAWGVRDLVTAMRWPALVPAAAALAAVVACTACTWAQTAYWQNSVALWRHAAEVTEDNPIVHLQLGNALARAGKDALAVDEYRELLKWDPSSPGVRVQIGKILEKQGDSDGASSEYRQELAVNPDSEPAHSALGQILEQRGDVRGAWEHYQAALRLNAQSADAQNNVARALERKGELTEALAHFQKALDLNHGTAETYNGLGAVLTKLGRYGEAREMFKQALRLDPKAVETYTLRGKCQEAERDFAGAAASYRQALKLLPAGLQPVPEQFFLFHANLAYALYEGGQTAEAAREYQAAGEIAPTWPEVFNRQARALATDPAADRRDGALALRQAKQVCQATSFRRPEYLETLAAAYAELGRYQEALDVVRQAAALAREQKKTDLAKELEAERALYQKHQPLRG